MKDDYVHPRGQAPGMELRDWFAGMALCGMLANEKRISNSDTEARDYAMWSYQTADAMISERNKEQNND